MKTCPGKGTSQGQRHCTALPELRNLWPDHQFQAWQAFRLSSMSLWPLPEGRNQAGEWFLLDEGPTPLLSEAVAPAAGPEVCCCSPTPPEMGVSRGPRPGSVFNTYFPS